MRRIAVALLFGTLVLSPGISLADEELPSLEQLVVEMADTPEQHAALARYYRAKAADARAEVARHEGMAGSYARRGKKTGVQQQKMQKHCKELSASYSAMAGEFDGLARLHDEQAK